MRRRRLRDRALGEPGLSSYRRETSLAIERKRSSQPSSPTKNEHTLFFVSRTWLGMRDSNPRMVGPEPTALPLGESPTDYSVLIILAQFI